jgi:hypothetical protein
MGKIKSIISIFMVLIGLNVWAQEKQTSNDFLRSHVTIDGMKYYMLLGINYKYSFWHNEKGNWQIGAQTGLSYGLDNVGYHGWSVPFGFFLERGTKHKIGFDAAVLYQWQVNEVGNMTGADGMLYPRRLFYDNGAFASSLYYSYNIGKDLMYSFGAGANIVTYFGENYGQEIGHPTIVRPYISFGVRF